MKKYLSGEYDSERGMFWLGASGCEFIARKGAYQVFVHPTWEYPHPPSECIQFSKRIETLEDFNDALDNGVYYKVTYEEREGAIEEGQEEDIAF